MFFQCFCWEQEERCQKKFRLAITHVFRWDLYNNSVLLNRGGFKLLSFFNYFVQNIMQKKKAIKFRSQRLYSKEQQNAYLRKPFSATKCAITEKKKKIQKLCRKFSVHMQTYISVPNFLEKQPEIKELRTRKVIFNKPNVRCQMQTLKILSIKR